MSLYAIGDLHLAFSVDKPMDLFGRGWKNHEKKIEKYWRRRVRPEDTVVLTGDHSWGKKSAGVRGGPEIYREPARAKDPAPGQP